MEKNIITAEEKRLAQEFIKIGYYLEFENNIVRVHKQDSKYNLYLLFTIDKRFYWVDFYPCKCITIDAIELLNKLLSYYRKKWKKEVL